MGGGGGSYVTDKISLVTERYKRNDFSREGYPTPCVICHITHTCYVCVCTMGLYNVCVCPSHTHNVCALPTSVQEATSIGCSPSFSMKVVRGSVSGLVPRQ